MGQKKGKPKISKVKRNNQTRTKLTKQGKLKSRRNRKPQKQIQKVPNVVKHEEEEEEEESDHGEDMMHMVEKDDLEFLKRAISDKSYNLLKQIRLVEPEQGKQRRKRKKQDDDHLEEDYEFKTETGNGDSGKKMRMLLPIKSQDGFIKRHTFQEDVEEDEEQIEEDGPEETDQDPEPENSDQELELEFEDNLEIENGKPVSTAELLACREEVLRSRRFKIGVLSSGLLENPELKSGNFKVLLSLMEEDNPEVYITVRKLATVSLLEVFKDLIPSYQIKQIDTDGVKLKKDTLQLQTYEATLLRSYKHYLQKLEKLSMVLRRKRGDTRKTTEQEMRLGEVALNCMCDLLVTHPYFNFSVNIANLLVPFLDNRVPNARATVVRCITQLFKEDKRGDLSLVIVRRINQHIKLRGHSVHSEVLSVLLALRIKDVNLDKEKEDEMKQKKLMTHKQRLLAMSKRERKRSKKLEEVEKEMMETKAEENKQSKQQVLTEITSIVFTIYFRILKQAPNSKVLSVTLEGLAKFAHCINLEFYQDLVNVINRLLEDGDLGLREQLHCVQTVFTILSGQGEALNIDPHRFYTHLYKNLLNIHAGRNHADALIILRTLVEVLIKRRKKVSQNRLVAFVKRVASLALQLQHNGTLGSLGIIKTVMQLGTAADILLDTDCSTGDGFYQPELDEPEYCNANCTALWELVPLQKHYHPMVQKMAKNIAWGVPTSGEGCLAPELAKLSPEELFNEFDPSGVAFKPAIPVPKKATPKKTSGRHYFSRIRLEEYLNEISNKPLVHNGPIDFRKAIKLK